jgi:hypothetical protein
LRVAQRIALRLWKSICVVLGGRSKEYVIVVCRQKRVLASDQHIFKRKCCSRGRDDESHAIGWKCALEFLDAFRRTISARNQVKQSVAVDTKRSSSSDLLECVLLGKSFIKSPLRVADRNHGVDFVWNLVRKLKQ